MSKRESLPPEDSIPLRIVVYLMTLTCILSSCVFIKTAWPVAVLGFTLCTVGSLVAYQYRHESKKWMQLIVIVGVLGVGANALAEFMNPMNGPADFWGPVVHFVAGTFALHAFDLKSRSDINLSAMLGALILCCLSPVARSLAFGGAVLTYISLGTVMLYYDCMSRTLTNWLDRPMKPAPVVASALSEKKRRPSGSAQLTLALLPLITLLSFLMVPRSDDTMDIITSSLKNMNLASLMRLLPDFSKHDGANQPKRNTYSAPLHNLGVKKLNDAEKKAAQLAAQEHKAEKPPDAPASAEGDAPASKPSEAGEKNGAKAEKKAKEEKVSDADKSAPKPGEKPGQNQAVKGGNKGKKEKAQKLAAAIAKANGGAGTGGTGGTKGTNGTNGTGGSGSTGGGGGGSLATKLVDMDALHDSKSKEILFKVSSTRLFYERRAVFDNFDGRFWMRSKDFITAKNIDIKPITAKPDAAVEPVVPVNSTNQPALSEEAQAEKELEEERLRAMDGELAGFGSTTAVHYVFFKPEKPNFDVKKANAFIVPKVLPTLELTQGYEVLSDLDNVVPVCWIPQMVGIGGKTVTVDDYGMVQSSEILKKGDSFKVVSQLPLYDTARMRNDPPRSMEQENLIRKQLTNYLQLPDDLSNDVVTFANQSAGQTGNWFSTADKICKILRTHAQFELTKPTDFEAADDRINQFLFERKKGNSKDFAATFVVLCRCVGLPARLVSGYGIGKTNKISGMREVSSSDSHLWSEVFIPEYGWVPFDAVPDGILPAQAREEGYSFSALEKMVEAQTGMNLSDNDGFSVRRILGWVAIIFSSLILLAGIVYGLIVLVRHLRREAALKKWRGPEWKLYIAIIKDLKKIKIERLEHETSTQFVHRVADIIKDRVKQGLNADRNLPNALSDFFTVYDAVHFGNKDLMNDLKAKASEVHKLVKSKGK